MKVWTEVESRKQTLSSQQFAAGGEDDGGDGGEEEHLFIDEILNVWQHIQNGEHMMEWDDEQAQSSSSNIQVAKQ